MRKIIVIFLLFSSLAINAQLKGSSEIKIGYGVSTTNQLNNFISDLLGYPEIYGVISKQNTSHSGSIFAEYIYGISDKITLNTGLYYENKLSDIFSGDVLLGQERNSYFSIGVSSSYYYVSNRLLKLYSGLGIGATTCFAQFMPKNEYFDKSKNNSFDLNFQLTGIGLRYGKKLALFGELGYGYKGILNGGVAYQF